MLTLTSLEWLVYFPILSEFVEASTPKFGEWAERWDSREPRNGTGAKYHNSKGFYCTGFARIPAFGQLSKFGGGRLYLDDYWIAAKNPENF